MNESHKFEGAPMKNLSLITTIKHILLYITRAPRGRSSCLRGWADTQKQTSNNDKTSPFYRIKKY